MGKYATKGSNDEGDEVWLANDGKEYKTRAGAWKRSKTLEEKEAVETESNGCIVEEPKVEPTVEPEVVVDETAIPDTSWVTFDDYDTDVNAEKIPSQLKKIRPASRSRGKMTKKEIEAASATIRSIQLRRTSSNTLAQVSRSELLVSLQDIPIFRFLGVL